MNIKTLIAALFLSGSSLAAGMSAACAAAISDDVLAKYNTACQDAAKWLEQWQSDVVVFPTQLKTNYTRLQTALENAQAVDLEDEAAVKSATTKINTAINNFKTSAENSKNTQKQVSKTKFDPNFHIYLCFGQSNMEGNATPELEDYSGSTTRFLTMAAVNMSTHSRTKGKWYVARPPLCRDWTGLTPADYFGKELVKQLPDSITVGVINVALGGCAIEMFMYQGDELKTYLTKQADWLQGYARDYNNQPYDQLIALAKEAQKVGVIKGVLLHQGCSNNTQQDWPNKVNVIYQRMLKDLNLEQGEVPLLIGELLSQAQGGVCWGHNSVIAKCPGIIANSHVVSSKDCPGAADGLHFTALGYRMIGKNYADVMRPLLARYFPERNVTVKSLAATDRNVVLSLSGKKSLYMTLTDLSGKKYDVTAACTFVSSDPDLVSFDGLQVIGGTREGSATVTATFVNEAGEEVSTTFNVSVRTFPLTTDAFVPDLQSTGTFSLSGAIGVYKSGSKTSMGGWRYAQGVDLSAYRYLAIDFSTRVPAGQTLRIYDVDDVNSDSYYSLTTEGPAQIVSVDLQNMQSASGKQIDPSHICIVGLAAGAGGQTVRMRDVFVTNDDPTAICELKSDVTDEALWYDLSGHRVTPSQPGIYVRNGKKVLR